MITLTEGVINKVCLGLSMNFLFIRKFPIFLGSRFLLRKYFFNLSPRGILMVFSRFFQCCRSPAAKGTRYKNLSFQYVYIYIHSIYISTSPDTAAVMISTATAPQWRQVSTQAPTDDCKLLLALDFSGILPTGSQLVSHFPLRIPIAKLN